MKLKIKGLKNLEKKIRRLEPAGLKDLTKRLKRLGL